MVKQVIVTLTVIIGLLVLVIGIASAQEITTSCIKPCPDCIVTVTVPECPSLTCADNVLVVPGLWEVTTNKRLCGEIVLGPSWVIIDNETLMLNKVKKMVRVENCN